MGCRTNVTDRGLVLAIEDAVPARYDLFIESRVVFRIAGTHDCVCRVDRPVIGTAIPEVGLRTSRNPFG